MLSFVGKHLSFYPGDVFSFSVFLLFKWKGVKPQVCLIKYVQNEISNSTSHTHNTHTHTHTHTQEEQKYNQTSKTYLKLLKNFH